MLELGCSDGGNLLGMAVELPQSSFLGIDAAASAIEQGQERARDIGLSNVELRAADILELPDQLGEFDYIVSHGFYSWVPAAVRRKLLQISQASLAKEGVAFVSYNALPGGYLRKPARELMLFHLQNEADPARRIEQGIGLLSKLTASVPASMPYRAVLERELGMLVEAGSSFVFHDALAPENAPCYFSEFCAQAAAVGLGYLADAHFVENWEAAELNGLARSLPEQAGADVLRAEQYLDFLKGRMFRQTLLVHQSQTARRQLQPARLRELFASARLEAAGASQHAGGAQVESFRSARGMNISTDNPVAKLALKALSDAHPGHVAFAELLELVLAQSGLSAAPEAIASELVNVLLYCYASDVIELRREQPRLVQRAGERPCASPLARAQAQAQEERLTNLRHALVELHDDRARQLLARLDGSRTREELARGLSGVAPDQAVGSEALERVDALLRGLAVRGLLLS